MSLKLTEVQKGVLYGVVASFSFATYLFINRFVYVTYDVEVYNYTSTFLLAGAGVASLALLTKQKRKEIRDTDQKQLNKIAVFGILAGFGLGSFVFGQGYTTAVNASILATSTILTTAIFSKLILKERLAKSQMAWLAVMFVGLYVAIVGFTRLQFSKGDIIILLGAVVLGFTNVFSKVLMRKNSSEFIADSRLVAGGVFFGILGLLISGPDFLVTNAGLWPLVSGFLFWVTIRAFYGSIRHISPTQSIVLTNLEPIIVPILAVVILSEPYSLQKFLGTVLALSGIYFFNKNTPSN